MPNSHRYCWLALALLVACARPALAIPTDDLLKSLKPSADVNDYAGVLSAVEKESLEARCRALREKTGAQLAVVTIKSLDGGEIEDFTDKLFKHWGIGQKGKDNGLLLIVAMNEHRSRIEVGYGLEPIIPDILAGRIVDQQIRPAFRQGKYAQGLTDAVDKISELVEKGEPADRAALEVESQSSTGSLLGMVAFLTLFVAVGGFIFGVGLGAKKGAGLLFGLIFAGGPMLMGVAAAGLLSLAVHLPVAVLLAILGWKAGKNNDQPGGRRFRGGTYQPTTWTWGDTSGRSGGWSSGGGGFSQGWGGFGGGSSGGGGASGSW